MFEGNNCFRNGADIKVGKKEIRQKKIIGNWALTIAKSKYMQNNFGNNPKIEAYTKRYSDANELYAIMVEERLMV